MCFYIYFPLIYVNLISILSCLDLFPCNRSEKLFIEHSIVALAVTVNLIFIPFRIFRIFICIISASFLADYEGNSCHTFCCFCFLLVIVLCGTCATFWTTTSAWADSLSPALNLRPYILPRWLAWPGLGWLGLCWQISSHFLY